MIFEILKVLAAGIIVLIAGLPIVIKLDKWKKEMDADEQEEHNEQDNNNRC